MMEKTTSGLSILHDKKEPEQHPVQRRSSYLAEEEDVDDLEGSITASESSDYSEHDDSFHQANREQTKMFALQRGSHNTSTSVETEI